MCFSGPVIWVTSLGLATLLTDPRDSAANRAGVPLERMEVHMPELPEVETVARQLCADVSGRIVRNLQLFDRRLGRLAVRRVRGCRAVSVSRLGKLVVFKLLRSERCALYLAVHLRMTGRLIWDSSRRSPESTHLRARLNCTGGRILFYDTRRFGTLTLHDDVEELLPKGLDPTSSAFSYGALSSLLGTSTQAIKVWLLRQDRLVGVGNIYANEILFAARIHPLRSVASLLAADIKRLHQATRSVLTKAIKHCGTTFSDFQNARGLTGSFQRYLKVYKREGQACRRCKHTVQRAVQQQRTTFFCPHCQR